MVRCSLTDHPRKQNKFQVTQSAVPTAAMWLPVAADAASAAAAEDLLVIANDQYKFKICNGNTNLIKRLVLGPTYGGPVSKCVAWFIIVYLCVHFFFLCFILPHLWNLVSLTPNVCCVV